ncbi:MAG: aldehyde dehydrogenase, partial [Gaiellales bacterium]|nr:aldehyde dehydrogenase [Gaiellales bacterium]
MAATTPFEYAPAPESRDIARLRSSYGIFVDGEFREGTGDVVPTIDPSTGAPLADVAEAGPEDVESAVAAARHAYDSVWGGMPGRDRAKYLFRVARAIQERGRELAVLESLDNG